jgi:hypothetical protein
MDWTEYAPPAKPETVRDRKLWTCKRIDIENNPHETYLLVEFAYKPDEFLSDYQSSTVVVQWETDDGITMNTALVEVLNCRRCTVPNPVVEMWCKMTKLYACIRFDARP